MASCIMDLYRSATPRIFDHWGDALAPTAAPGLVLHAADDSVRRRGTVGRGGRHARAPRQATLTGVGHWWAVQDPDQAAATLNGFHASIG